MGLEPTTGGITIRDSTIELLSHLNILIRNTLKFNSNGWMYRIRTYDFFLVREAL